VQQVELIPPPDFIKNAVYKTLSPVVVSVGSEDNRHPRYASPDEEHYGQLIINNLKEKYRLFYQRPFEEDSDFKFELLSPPRSKLIRIKADTKEETRVRGFVFTFRLEADRELLKVMYEAGMGEKNAQGFGCVNMNSDDEKI
jgi:CRISPR-associated endoribonuclease Cas6